MIKRQTAEEKSNPLHRTHSLWSNISYTVRGMVQNDRTLCFLIPLGVLCVPFTKYLWIGIARRIVDGITGQGGTELLRMVLAGTVIQMLASVGVSYSQGETEWRYIYGRLLMMLATNRKAMEIDFEHLEDSDVMDCHEKAAMAASSNWVGLEGMMRELAHFLESLAIVAVGLLILGTMNFVVVFLMCGLAVLSFLIKNHTEAVIKEKIEDPQAPYRRKQNYMQDTATDFGAAKDIRMFGIREWLLERFREINEEINRAEWSRYRWELAASAASHILWAAAQIVIYVWLIRGLIRGELTLGDFTLYVASSATFFEYVALLFTELSRLFQRSREVDDFRSFQEFEGGDKADTGRPVPAMDHYEFTFQNVSFRYPKAKRYALRHLNLTVKAGERLAVVGLNGAGKSTFIKLLLRLYEPTEGSILLNGVDVREYDKRSYYRIFAPVFQDVNLFSFPLAENVSMKSPEETDRKRAGEMLTKAGLGDKLKELPQGVDTEILKVLHDDGVDLSGGEKQKLMLARALYKDAPVMLLDEPTAALDALAENKLYQDFDRLIGGRTAVYISHRLSSTRFCSHVAMFRDGEMAEYGTHESLMAAGGAYARMFELQARYYVENQEETTA